MTTLYKLTDQNGYTRAGYDNACLWGSGVSHSGTGKGDLCGPGYVHAYTNPLLAVLLNPIHANIRNLKMWECEGQITKSDRGLKVGCVTLTTVREISLPVVTTDQRVRFAILCTKEVYKYEDWNAWADKWLSGENRSGAAAADAYAAAYAAARTADAYAAARAAAAAAYAAARAADADAAYAAARAAAAARADAAAIDLIGIVKKVMEE